MKFIRAVLALTRPGLLVVLLVSIATLSAQANVNYTYHGMELISRTDQNFTPCPSPCVLTGTFTLAAALPANYSGTLNPIASSFTDGTMVLDNFNSSVSASVMTDATGNISSWWAIQLDAFDAHHSIATINAPGNTVRDSTFNFISQVPPGIVYEADNFNSPGYWTMNQTTPEPGTLCLLGGGLLAAIGYGRRRLGL